MCKYPSVAGAWDDNLKTALGRQNMSSSTTLPLSVHYRMNWVLGRHGVFTFSNADFFKYIILNIIWSRHGQWLVGFHAEVAGLDGLRREVS